MMIVVSVVKQTGLFEYIAIWAAKRARGKPYRVMVLLCTITAVASALLDNVTTVLLIAPVTLLVCARIGVRPELFLIAEAMATQHRRHRHPDRRPAEHHHRQPGRPVVQRLPGQPGPDRRHPDRRVRASWPASCSARRSRYDAERARRRDGARRAGRHPRPPAAWSAAWPSWRSILAGFLLHSVLHFDPSVVALLGAGLLVLISRHESDEFLEDVEWETLVFFAGLFVMVGALVNVGVIE